LPRHAQIIVLATPMEHLSTDERAELMQWVVRGGHLISNLADPDDSSDSKAPQQPGSLQRLFDVHLRESEKMDSDLRSVTVSGEGSLQAHFDPSYFLQPGKIRPVWSVRDNVGLHALRFRYGEGYITLISDDEWMDNCCLDDGDHGALLWRLVDVRPLAGLRSFRPDKAPEVWLIYDQDRQSLLQLLWQNASALIVATLVFVLAWVWQSMQRFGPLRSELPSQRRRLTEHLQASGRYLLRQHALDRLFDASRQRLLAQVQRRHPQWRALAPDILAQEIIQYGQQYRNQNTGQNTGQNNGQNNDIKTADVVRLLTQAAPSQLLSFAADIRLINRLRKFL
jgi:hypothetical protein